MAFLSRVAGIAILSLVLVSPGLSQEEAGEPPPARIYEQTPFDEITLKDKSIIKVEPIGFPNRQIPQNPRSTDKLVLHLLDKPDEAYELAWRDIAQIRLFENMVLEEGQKLVAAGEFDQAYDYFDFLERNYPKMPGLDAAFEKYLYQDAQHWQRRRQYDYVLVLLNQLHARNPGFPALDRALGIVTDKLVEERLARREYQAAHALLRSLEKKYPQETQVAQLRQKLQSLADESLAEAKRQQETGQLRKAQESCCQALQVWPAHKQARALLIQLHQQFPFVAVGVTQPLVSQQVRLDNWAANRSARLLRLPLVEFTGQGGEGGNYVCPFGNLQQTDLGLRLTFRLRGDVHWPGGAPLTGLDIARTLLEEAADSGRFAPWRRLIDRVDVPDLFSAEVRFQQAPVQPAALFQTTLLPPAPLPVDASISLFTLAEQSAAVTTYTASDASFARTEHTPREIVEYHFARGQQAIEALKRRDVSLIDRINPWEIPQFRDQPEIALEPYAVPTVHCLLVNPRLPLLSSRTFRRALLYGIQRESILQVQILRGKELPPARVVSGPFPTGYAYNDAVEVRAYDPRMAMMLAAVAVAEVASDQKSQSQSAGSVEPDAQSSASAPPAGSPPAKDSPLAVCPTLRLAHPASDVARLACRTIQRQLGLIKIPVNLIELPPGRVADATGDYDLVYAELQIGEPLIDVARLFGPTGLLPNVSPYLRAALDRVWSSTDWKSAREALQDVHQIVADELMLIPLYQLPEHFAYRRTIREIGSRPASLYQNISLWQTDPELPPSE
jgi:ABC-type transport system substrate-binding protein